MSWSSTLGRPPGRKRAAAATSLAVERPHSSALSCSGAVRSSARSWLTACVRALSAERTPRHVQDAYHLRRTVGALGLADGSVRLERPRGGLGVGGVVLAEPAPVLAVRTVHLDDLHPSGA